MTSEFEVLRLRKAIVDIAMWSHIQEHGGYIRDGQDRSFESCGKEPCHRAHMHLAGYVGVAGVWTKVAS